jgi:hypothetical protein
MRSAVWAVLLGGICCISGLIGATRDASAEQSTPQPASTDPARQAEMRGHVYQYLINEPFNLAMDARKKGDCGYFRFYVDGLGRLSSQGIRDYASGNGVFLPPAQRQEILRRRDQLLATLRRLDCPSRTAVQPEQTAQSTPQSATSQTPTHRPLTPEEVQRIIESAQQAWQIYIAGGGSTTRDIKVSNGGLGGNQSVTSPNLDLGVIFSGGVEARSFFSHGSSRVNRSGVGGLQAQFNGSQNLIGIGQGIITSDAEVTRVGGSLRFDLPGQSIGGLPLRPFVGGGAEYFRLKTNLHGLWNPISFSFNDSSDIENHRIHVFGGSEIDIASLPTNLNLFVRWTGQFNVDIVDGKFVYSSQQFGVPLGPPATGSASKTAVTFGGELGLGGTWTFANGNRLTTYTWVGFTPVWEVDKRVNQPWTLQQEQRMNYGFQATLRLPITGPRPFDLEALLRGVQFR